MFFTGNKPLKCFKLVTGKTLDTDKAVMGWLKEQISALQEVSTVEECEIILVFCPVIRGAALDYKAALEKLNQTSGILKVKNKIIYKLSKVLGE